MPSPRKLVLSAVLSAVLPAALPAALVAATLSVSAPASAVPTGSTSAPDVVLYDHCQHVPVHYDLALDPGTTTWQLVVRLFDPAGRTSEQRTLRSSTDPTEGTVRYLFCGGAEQPGTYMVRATVDLLVPLLPSAVALPDSTFEVRPMATRTALATSTLRDGRHRLVTRVRQEAERGYERADGIPVRLERKGAGGWKRVAGLTLTTVRGRAVAVVSRRGTYRAVVTERDNHAASTSRPVHVS